MFGGKDIMLETSRMVFCFFFRVGGESEIRGSLAALVVQLLVGNACNMRTILLWANVHE